MKPISPSDINASTLRRSVVGGYDAEATEDFIRAVASNYAWLYQEWETLTETLEHQAAEHLEALASLWAELERRKHPDELARLVLQASHRVAREVREAARIESEAAIRNARRRAAAIESEIERTKASIVADIAALDRERERLRKALHTTLTGVLDAVERPLNGASASGNETGRESDGLVQALQARTTQSDQ